MGIVLYLIIAGIVFFGVSFFHGYDTGRDTYDGDEFLVAVLIGAFWPIVLLCIAVMGPFYAFMRFGAAVKNRSIEKKQKDTK